MILKTILARFGALVILGLGAAISASAHDVPCPLCGLRLVQATKDRDNEVVLRYGRKKIEYRCVYCALADAKRYDGDLIVYAPSETKGSPVLLQRTGGKWATVKEENGKLVPEPSAVFLNAFPSHKSCAALSRAFHDRAGFDAYDAKPKDAKPLDLGAMLAQVGMK